MNFENNWKYKTLEHLEGNEWIVSIDEHIFDDLKQIRKKPLNRLKASELKLLIYQNLSLKYSIPLAIEYLKKDIMTIGDIIPGDLLEEVLLSDTEYWKSNKELWGELSELIDLNYQNIMKQLPKDIYRMEMDNAIDNYREINNT